MNSSTVLRVAVAMACAMLTVPTATAHTGKPHAEKTEISKDLHPWGQQGDAKKVTRTIQISMNDNMRFTPEVIDVKQGEVIKFVVKNAGKAMHEMVIGTAEELDKHAALMRKHPNMEHDEPYMAHVASSKSVDLIWNFSKPGAFMFACLIPGHFEAGMKGVINVAAKSSAKKS